MGFPREFVWGTAAASYQIEGAAYEDGKGPSVWDMFCKKPGAVWQGQSGETACDHYHRYGEDVGLMKELGIGAYRFSISWPRILPEGIGATNPKGLAFYDRLVDSLLEAGIQPYITLFHWDFPLALYHRGGWLNRDSADWFAAYTEVVVKKLGDRVKHWMTFNEPQVFIGAGHHEGWHAPGEKLRFAEVLRGAHHVLLAHGRAVQALRALGGPKADIGIASVGTNRIPATARPEDIAAARKSMFSIAAKNVWTNTWWMDPMFFGRYPEDGLRFYGEDVPEIRAGDMETIHSPIDFLGVNIYNGLYIREGADGEPEVVPPPVGFPISAFEWAISPEVMYWAPRFLYDHYKKPIMVTENGISCRDWVSLDGKVHDPTRIDFTARHLRELTRAIDDGVPVSGYFHWSILDNFEWAEGYKQRFGLVFVDYPTGRRIPKDSAFWYREVIRSNGAAVFGRS